MRPRIRSVVALLFCPPSGNAPNALWAVVPGHPCSQMLCLLYFRDTHAFIRFTGYTLATIMPYWPLVPLSWIRLDSYRLLFGITLLHFDLSLPLTGPSLRSPELLWALLCSPGLSWEVPRYPGAISWLNLAASLCNLAPSLLNLVPSRPDLAPHWLNSAASSPNLALSLRNLVQMRLRLARCRPDFGFPALPFNVALSYFKK